MNYAVSLKTEVCVVCHLFTTQPRILFTKNMIFFQFLDLSSLGSGSKVENIT